MNIGSSTCPAGWPLTAIRHLPCPASSAAKRDDERYLTAWDGDVGFEDRVLVERVVVDDKTVVLNEDRHARVLGARRVDDTAVTIRAE